MPAFFDGVTTTSAGSEPSLSTDMVLSAVDPGASASMASGALVGSVDRATVPPLITLSGT